MTHVIFDWNGTLLDDVHILLECDSRVGADFGWWPPVSLEYYRSNFTRNWQRYYSGLAGRELTTGEIEAIDARWHEHYEMLKERAALFPDVLPSLDALEAARCSKSLHSMHPHDKLLLLVERFGLQSRFSEIDGLKTTALGGSKTEHLRQHVERLRNAGVNNPVIVGDNRDDGIAAKNVGIRAILVTTGEHPLSRLADLDWPVVNSLREACERILGN